MSATSQHLATAREYIAIAESDDSKLEAWKRAADEILAARRGDPTLGWRGIQDAVGKSYEWCRELVQWRTSVKDPTDPPFGGAAKNEARYARQAKTVLKDPERRQNALAQLPTEQVEQVIQQAHAVVMDRLHAKQAEHATAPTTPTAGDLMGGDRFDPSESWADADIIRVREKAHTLRRQVEKWGLVLGSMNEEQAFEYLQEAERNIAEVRVALQERMADRSRAEV